MIGRRLALVATLPLAWPGLVGTASAFTEPDLDIVARLIFLRTNQLRHVNRVPLLYPEPRLARAATEFAARMAAGDRYGHRADGRAPAERVLAQGYDFQYVAENIAHQFDPAGFTTEALAAALVEGWRRSPGHLHNMLSPLAADSAVGLAYSVRSKRFYAVQLFGRLQARQTQLVV